jgi:RHS repeat-associated protein
MDPECDPNTESCEVELRLGLEFPGNIQNLQDDDGAPTPRVWWFTGATPPSCTPWPNTPCSILAECGQFVDIPSDFIDTFIRITATCESLRTSSSAYSIKAANCITNDDCREPTLLAVGDLRFDDPALASQIGCPVPPPDDCSESPNMCTMCQIAGAGPAGGAPAGGPAGGPGGEGGPTGPGATLRYRGSGAGHPGFPGTTAWNTELGRYWSHDYAMRIVEDPNDSHVWLITGGASFREFSDLSGGEYGTAKPSDEKRTLRRTGGWELEELDGTVHAFDTSGRWLSTVDRNGNTTEATYTGGQLDSVSFPDGRREDFTYSSGRLATITEVGVDGTTTALWEYTWIGLDLTRIDRPDGTALRYVYGDAGHPGYVTRVELEGTDGTSVRIVRAYAYDTTGNVIDTWAGNVSPTGPDAVDRWQYAFDNPLLPAETTVTDPLGDTSTYSIGRDPASRKPRLLETDGDCPSCGLGPNTTLVYGDSSNPLEPTSVTDANGNETLFTYDAYGQVTSKTEAVGSAVERTTTWEYHPTYHGLVTERRQPSTSGSGDRVTTWDRDPANGNPTTVTIEGFEAGAAFSYDTVTTYNDDSDGGGMPLTVNPPGYGTSDVTSYAYDPTRGNGNLILTSRTDPLVGTTGFDYDDFNRRTVVTDPNGVATETLYDPLDRVRFVIERSAGSAPGDPTVAADLVTEHVFDVFGDLDHTILPEGNVVDYGYDAAGRLVTLERKPDLSTPKERILYTLDGAGNRIRQDLQSWSGSAWVSASFTDYVYSTRCRLDKVVHADGSVTEYAYDCNGNLERVWDANHPSVNQTEPPTQVYGYDELDRLVSLTQPWTGAGGGDAVTGYGYDVQDHLSSVTDAEGNLTVYVYSDRDLMTAEAAQFLATGGSCGTFPDCTQAGCGCTTSGYNAHGELVTQTDPRGVTVTRTVDELDRVTFVDYPDAALDTTYVYDDPSVDFSKGRLTEISRSGVPIRYEYDRFGRVTSDAERTYAHDENGNPTRIGHSYFGVATDAVYTYDFADRQQTLTLEPAAGSPEPLVTASSYKAFGPLTSLTLANGVSESRTFDVRYHPKRIIVTGPSSTLLDWSYTVDDVGNVEAIADLLNSANNRTFDYQDVHYFLTQGDGPWADLSWTYDKIGNRLTETRDGTPTSYTYALNGNGGRTPLLTQAGGTTYSYDSAGDLTSIVAPSGSRTLTYDDAGRLTQAKPAPKVQLDLTYDGRGFLRETFNPALTRTSPPDWAIHPLYDSSGRLQDLERQLNPTGPVYNGSMFHVYYFAGRPVAVRQVNNTVPPQPSPVTTTYSTDHLGTPILVADAAGAVLWSGGLEPFGEDSSGALAAGVFLRLPGQWEDDSWIDSTAGDLYHNVHRWYEAGTGRYTRPDPWGIEGSGPQLYLYAEANPLRNVDPDGRFIPRACGPDDVSWCQQQCSQRRLRYVGCQCFRVPLCFGLLDHAVAECKDWQKGCPPCPAPPPPEIDKVPPSRPHFPCKGDHWHYWVYNQEPPPTCTCHRKRMFGGCL